MHVCNVFNTRFLATTALLVVLTLGIISEQSAFADKVFYKSGKVVEGIVQEEFPSRVKFLYQGRVMMIPRNRIDRIEKGSGVQNIIMLMERVDESLAREEFEPALEFYEKAMELNPTGEYLDQLDGYKKKIDQLRLEGSAEERRRKAEAQLKLAVEAFDRIQPQQGVAHLQDALRLDSSYSAAHEEMAKYMRDRDNLLNINSAAEYFTDYVDPEMIKSDHPIIDLLPQIFFLAVEKVQSERDPEKLRMQLKRVKKMADAYESFPDWKSRASDTQRALINKGSYGIAEELMRIRFNSGDYRQALFIVESLGKPTESPQIAELYARVYIGLEEFDKAVALLESEKENFSSASAVEDNIAGIKKFAEAKKAMDESNHKAARDVLEEMYTSTTEYYPELRGMVSQAKVRYDLTAMEALESADMIAEAADLAIKIHKASSDESIRDQAADAFDRFGPQLAFGFKFQLRVDGKYLNPPQEWTPAVRAMLTERLALNFEPESPFLLTLTLELGTFNNGVAALEAALAKDDMTAMVLPATSATRLQINAEVKHLPTQEVLSYREYPAAAIPPAVRAMVGPDEQAFVKLESISSFNLFMRDYMVHYLPAELALVGTELSIRDPQ